MTKQELMENFTMEQLADIIVKSEEKWRNIKMVPIVIKGCIREYTIQEITEMVIAHEEIKSCKEQNKECKTALPIEYLKILELNQKLEDKTKEINCIKCELKTIKEKHAKVLFKYCDSISKEECEKLKQKLDRKETTINQIDDILENLFGVRHDVGKPNEFEEILKEKIYGNITIEDFLPEESIKVADILINATYTREKNP